MSNNVCHSLKSNTEIQNELMMIGSLVKAPHLFHVTVELLFCFILLKLYHVINEPAMWQDEQKHTSEAWLHRPMLYCLILRPMLSIPSHPSSSSTQRTSTGVRLGPPSPGMCSGC